MVPHFSSSARELLPEEVVTGSLCCFCKLHPHAETPPGDCEDADRDHTSGPSPAISPSVSHPAQVACPLQRGHPVPEQGQQGLLPAFGG